MPTFRRISIPVTHLVLVGLLAFSLHVPSVHAGLVGTDTMVYADQTQEARNRLHTTLDRQDVQQALLARGVSADQVRARVDALTDQEVRQLSANLDRFPVGGDAFGLAVFVFLVLLITDILGFTDIFPFVKKPVRH